MCVQGSLFTEALSAGDELQALGASLPETLDYSEPATISQVRPSSATAACIQ